MLLAVVEEPGETAGGWRSSCVGGFADGLILPPEGEQVVAESTGQTASVFRYAMLSGPSMELTKVTGHL
jgi:hypothetical protein